MLDPKNTKRLTDANTFLSLPGETIPIGGWSTLAIQVKGCPILSAAKGGMVHYVQYADGPHTTNDRQRISFHHHQLLPPYASLQHCSISQYFSARTGKSAAGISICYRGLRGHAGTRPSLIGEPNEGSVPTIMKMLKQRVAHTALGAMRRKLGSAPKQFWQTRYYDFNIFNDKKL